MSSALKKTSSAPARTACPSVAVIIPCYNEETAIGQTFSSLKTLIEQQEAVEIVFVDDGSTDTTGAELARGAGAIKNCRIIRHPQNQGYGAALKTGIRRTRGEWIVITDADGTYPNDRILGLLELARDADADMVVGARTGYNEHHSRIQSLAKWVLLKWVRWLTGQPVPDMNSGLRVIRRSAAEKFLRVLPDGFSFTTSITIAMLRSRRQVEFVPIPYARRIGRSKVKPVRDMLRFLQLILRTGIYFAPMRTIGPLAMALFLLFCGLLAYDVTQLKNITDKTVMVLMFSINAALFALLADMIDRRTG